MSNNKVKHCMCSQHRLNLTIPVLMAFFGTLTREVVHLSDVLTLRQKKNKKKPTTTIIRIYPPCHHNDTLLINFFISIYQKIIFTSTKNSSFITRR